MHITDLAISMLSWRASVHDQSAHSSLHTPCALVRQDSILVAGYPLGGDSLSITKGIVSRVTMTRYAHASNKLLGIQIDAAINPGNSGGPAFADLKLARSPLGANHMTAGLTSARCDAHVCITYAAHDPRVKNTVNNTVTNTVYWRCCHAPVVSSHTCPSYWVVASTFTMCNTLETTACIRV